MSANKQKHIFPNVVKGCAVLELDDRKEKILKAIIQTYFETGEPVGSRTISKYSDLQLSSATIRNEMSDLEELGYIIQPHTSAGRIPSDKGYRFYVDQLIKEKDNEITEIKDMVIQRVDRVELLLKQMAKLLAVNTNYATLISGPQYHHTKLKFIQLSKIEEGKLLIVTVLEGNIIKNSMVNFNEELSNEEMLNLNILLNNNLIGMAIDEINLDVISRMKVQAGTRREVIDLVLTEVAEAIHANEEELQIYTEGTTNIFKYPELSDGEKAGQLISALEQTDLLRNLFTDAPNANENGIRVYIGDETPVQSMKNCSIVTAHYELEGGLQGTIGIVGPKRMDYDKVVSALKSMMNQ
ncbi:MAG: heat-inducible transcriptional repressor HrcA, partial [Clostridium sp.]